MRVADWLMDAVARLGVKQVFVLPGGGAMHLNDALVQCRRLEWVPCHHEQSCGIAAEANGRIAGGLGVAMVTTGPGATNVLTPVAGAYIESTPLLVISGQVKRADLLNGAPLRQKGVQEVDIVAMVRPVTKYAVTVDDPQQVRWHFERAVHLALSGRRGPVWLDIPLDVQAAEVDPAALPGYTPEPEAQPPALDEAVARVARLLGEARRPLILAGHGVRLAGAAQALRGLAEATQTPVVTTWNALDLLPWEHALNAGRPGVVALRGGNFAVQNCDLLIAVGCRLDNVLTAYAPRNFARQARRVVVDVDPAELDKLDMALTERVEADAGDFLSALLRQAPACAPRDAWRTRIAQWKSAYPLQAAEGGAPGEISHAAFVDALSDALPPHSVVATGSSGLAVEFFYTGFRNKEGQRVFLTSGLGAMGYGLPAAIGACLADGRRDMVLVESDGSLMLNLQELATLKALNLPVAVIVMNNGGYASIRNTQRNYFAGRHIASGPESGLLIPELTGVAQAFGLPSLRIEGLEQLEDGLQAALALPRPCLIDVRLRRDEALGPKVSAMPQPDGSIVSMPLEDMAPLLPLDELKANMDAPLQAASYLARGLQPEA